MLTQDQKAESKLRALAMMNAGVQLSPEVREFLANNVADELDRRQAEIERLRKAVRGLAIARHSRMVSGGGFIPSGGSCELCNTEWAQDEAEHHAEGCLAKPIIKTEERRLA